MNNNAFLIVEHKTSTDEGWDEQPEDWEELRREWFQLKPLSGTEYVQGQQVQSTVTHTARCVFFSGANSQLRLKSTDGLDRIFNVESAVNWMERNRFLDWRLAEAT